MISLYRGSSQDTKMVVCVSNRSSATALNFLGLAEKIARPFVLDSEGNRESALGFDPVLS
jgi:hypothetical protein